MKYREYITNDGDRWDLISYKLYGNALCYEVIVNANPDVKIVPVLSGGIKLRIPNIEIENILSEDDLPPWKR